MQAAIAAEAEATATTVRLAVRTLSGRRADALIVVTGDHLTAPNSSTHLAEAVPIMLYGATAVAAAERALGTKLTAASMLEVPRIAAVDFPLIFPFYNGGDRACVTGIHRKAGAIVWPAVVVGCVAMVVCAVLVCRSVPRRKRE